MTEPISALSQLMSGLGVGVVVVCAIALIALSVRDFHDPWKIAEIRYSVLRERYYFALSVHAVFALIMYLVLVYLLWDWGSAVMRETSAYKNLQGSFGAASRSAVISMLLAVASVVALLVMVLVPRLPPFNIAADLVRRAMRELARYPQSAETLTSIIGSARLRPDESARAAMIEELTRYGVSRRDLKRGKAAISKISAETLEETYNLHQILAGMERDARFRKFFLARCDTAESLKLDNGALMRRAARAILAAEEVKQRGGLSDLTLDISEFIAEEADVLRAKHHRLLADACLSVLRTQEERRAFLLKLGYDIALPNPLPLKPLVIVFALDLLIGLSPIVIAPLTHVPDDAALKTADTAVFAAAHAIALTAAMFLAIWPKVVYSAARPSLYRLPLPSYALFGTVSYVIGVLLFYITFKTITIGPKLVAHDWPLAASFLFATIFPVTTWGISALLDRRLRQPSLDFWRNRRSDGIALAVALGATLIVILGIYYGLESLLEIPHPWRPEAQLFFVCFYALLGFAIGYLLPSAIESQIQAEQFIIESLAKSGKSIDSRYGESVTERIPAQTRLARS